MGVRERTGAIETAEEIKARTAKQTIIRPFDTDVLTKGHLNFWSVADQLEKATEERKYIKEELANMPEGKLIIRRKNKKNNYCLKKGLSEHGITKDVDLITLMVRKGYLDARLEELNDEINSHNRLIRNFDNSHRQGKMCSFFKRMRYAGYDISECIFSKKQNEWINEVYTPNPFYKENLIYKTESGIYLRSNGELNIATRLEERGIPYRSDDIVQITEKRTGKIKTYFADFKIPNLRGGISMLEHLGGFGFEGYGDNAIVKLNAYSECGIFNDSEIFWSFENTVNDINQLDRLIDRMLLPY